MEGVERRQETCFCSHWQHLSWFTLAFLHSQNSFLYREVWTKGGPVLSRQTSAGEPCVQASRSPNADFGCIIRKKTLGEERRHDLVLSESICGLVSTLSGLHLMI